MKRDPNLQAARNILWAQWIFINLLGWFGGILLTGLVVSVFGRELALSTWWGIGLVGLVVGWVQWGLLRRTTPVPRLQWVAASGVGMALGQTLSQAAVQLLPGLARASGGNLFAALLVGLLIGLIFGICLGFVQRLVLRDNGWLAVNLVGWAVAIATTGLMGSPAMGDVARLLLAVLAAVFASLFTGLWLRETLT